MTFDVILQYMYKLEVHHVWKFSCLESIVDPAAGRLAGSWRGSLVPARLQPGLPGRRHRLWGRRVKCSAGLSRLLARVGRLWVPVLFLALRPLPGDRLHLLPVLYRRWSVPHGRAAPLAGLG